MMEKGNVKAQIFCDEDCGNAPKKVVIKDLITAMARHDHDHIEKMISDQITLDIIGDRKIHGKEAFLNHLRSHPPILEVHIDHIGTNKNMGAANGTITYDGDNIPRVSFCHVYKFSSGKTTKIKSINSYHITDL